MSDQSERKHLHWFDMFRTTETPSFS